MYILLPLWLSTDYYYYDYYSTTTISTTIITIPLKCYSNKLVNKKRLLQRLIKQSFRFIAVMVTINTDLDKRGPSYQAGPANRHWSTIINESNCARAAYALMELKR